MRKFIIVAAMALPLTAGCAEFATGMAMYADELDAQAGYYYPDQHFGEHMTGDCSGYWESGRMNNQSYQRVRNTSPVAVNYTLEWSSGYETAVYLESGQTSEIYYMTPSITPSGIRAACSMPN